MTVTHMEIRYAKRGGQRSLALDKNTRDALADYCRERWPHHTAKMAAREWGLSVDEARGVLAARTSLTTYDKIKKAGGWSVILGVEAKVIGHGIDQYLADARKSHDDQASRLGALVGGLWPLAADRRPDRTDRDPALDQRGWLLGDRNSRRHG
jgi:hypothetical protein